MNFWLCKLSKKSLQNAGNGNIEIETDEQIVPGQEWDKQIRNSLDQSHVILFMVSRKFILSRYIKEVELRNAIDSNEGEPGPLLLQGDHGPIEYRNIVITPAKWGQFREWEREC